MYDEYERAVGARSGSGVSLLGWLGIAAVLVSLVGATGAFFAYRFVKGQVHEIAEQLRPFETLVSMEDSPMVGAVVAQTLAAAGASESLDADEIKEAITRAFAISSSESHDVSSESHISSSASQTTEESIEGQFRIRTGRGDFTANLDADGEQGRFVVRRPDGAVIVDLAADEDGGRLVFRSDGEEARIEAGDRAQADRPEWIGELSAAPESARSVLSGQLGGAEFGALTWNSEDDPQDLIDRLRQRLSDEGWQFEADHDLRDGGGSSASTIARLPETGRTVVFAAGTEDGVTTVVQGWAERRPEG